MSSSGQTGQTTIEPELQGRTPRRVRYTGSTQRVRLFVPLLLLGVMGLIAHFATDDVKQLQALQEHGVVVTGHITGRYSETSRNGTSYFLRYMFMTSKGVFRDAEDAEDASEYFNTEVGDPLTVTYLAANPDIHRVDIVDAGTILDSIRGGIFFEGIVALLLGLLIYFTEKNFRNHRSLLENGVAVTGRITGRDIQRGKSNTYYVQYEFAGPGGIVSESISVSRKLYDQTIPEAAATILYNPVKPSNNRPYSLITDVRLA